MVAHASSRAAVRSVLLRNLTAAHGRTGDARPGSDWYVAALLPISLFAAALSLEKSSQPLQGRHRRRFDCEVRPQHERFSGSQFEDASFPPSPLSIGQTRMRFVPEWRRVSGLHGHGQLSLFGPTGSVGGGGSQGLVGDCWLIGVFACVADFPGHVECLFREEELSKDGRYGVHLFDPKYGWRLIEIDDRVPCQPRARQPLLWVGQAPPIVDVPCFGRPISGVVWPLLLEKAFAKVAGDYGLLEGGIVEMAFQVITGQNVQLTWAREGGNRWTSGSGMWSQMRFVDPEWRGAKVIGGRCQKTGKRCSSDDLYLRLAYYDQANFMVAACIRESALTFEHKRSNGLIENHAYSVLEVQEVHGVRLVRLRNPWGKSSWNGDWSPQSSKWAAYPDVAADAHGARGGGDNGTFWISFEDFATNFDSVMVCPSTMPVPKASRYGTRGNASPRSVRCGRCGCELQSVWLLTVPRRSQSAGRPAARWERLADGDLCSLCLRSTAAARRAALASADAAAEAVASGCIGKHGSELHREVPGIDYFPFEAGVGCLLPTFRPVCEAGPACTKHNAEHFAAFDHPWMRPTRDILEDRRRGRKSDARTSF